MPSGAIVLCRGIVNQPANHPIPKPASFSAFDRCDLNRSIPWRFEQMVVQVPDRLAIKSGPVALTYQALNEFANRVANTILDVLGATPQPVAFLLGQHANMAAAILGVLKAGHFYVPLDASYPEAALRAVMTDSGARLIVTDARGLSLARRLVPALPPIDIDHLPSGVDSKNLDRDIAANDFAYIYYTSGSTGRPKGVVDTHGNVLHNVMRYTNGLFISPADRLTLLQSPAFSGAVSSLFGALLNGAASFPYDVPAGGIRGIGPWLLQERITIYHSVPALFRHFLGAAGEHHVFPAVRVVRLEGDRAAPAEIDLFKRHFADEAVLAHGLGATECGLVCRFVVGKTSAFAAPVVPIGYPVEDVTIRVLDDGGREVEAGEVGEIVVESRYLSPGYWNRPDLTERAFAQGRGPGERMYRTGDMGRMYPDGCLEHLGRKDFQPKLRGQRVEAEAIEAALLEIDFVAEAVVEVRNGPFEGGRLVAYVVPKTKGGQLSVTAIRRRVAGRLAANMIPARFVTLDAVPLTSNLKVDRKSLPEPSGERPNLDVPFIAPRSGLEAAIASVWAPMLGLDQIGVRDDFFELGGDSLSATLVLERIRQEHGADLSPQVLLAAPTVEGLARAVEATASAREGERQAIGAAMGRPRSPLLAVQPAGSRIPFFFLHAEFGGDGFYCLNVARHLGRDQPFFTLSPHGRDGGPMPVAVETMAADYVRTLRDAQARGPYLLGGFCSSAVVAWEMACQLHAAGEKVDLLVLIEPPSGRRRRPWRAVYAVANALVALAGRGHEERLTLMSLASKVAQRIRRRDRLQWRDVGRAATWIANRPRAEVPLPAIEDRRQRIAAIYIRAVQGYLPRRFDGPVLCLRAIEEASGRSVDEWRGLARDFAEYLIPGDHDSCIIEHPASLAERLSQGLLSAQRGLMNGFPIDRAENA
jgi:amino acid adenylation domain-containing protein